MTYEIIIGDQSFSSWSLRGWLMLEKFGLPYRTRLLSLYDGQFAEAIRALAPARLVPVLRCPDGTVIGETLAIAEELNSRHPEAQMWPADPAARAFARWISAEIHAGFSALRAECPMQLLHQYQGFTPSQAVLADLDRLQDLWSRARSTYGADGPWLFGRYSLADAFYAPVAARLAGYGLPMDAVTRAYVDTTLADPALRRWRAIGLQTRYPVQPYAMDLDTTDWPGPAPMAAEAVGPDHAGESRNDSCPYSGRPVTDFLRLEGRIYGFCNPGCRDKTVSDPAAWPAFMALVQG